MNTIYLFNRPPKSSIKPQSPVLTDDEEEEDQELIEAKIVLRDVSTAGKFISCDLNFGIYCLLQKHFVRKCKFFKTKYLFFFITDIFQTDLELFDQFYSDCKSNLISFL